MLNELFWSIGTTMISQSYSTRGLTVVAATNIAGTVWNLFCVIMFAMGNAVSIIIGQQLGAGEIEEAKRTDNKLLFFTVVLHIGVGALIAAPPCKAQGDVTLGSGSSAGRGSGAFRCGSSGAGGAAAGGERHGHACSHDAGHQLLFLHSVFLLDFDPCVGVLR